MLFQKSSNPNNVYTNMVVGLCLYLINLLIYLFIYLFPLFIYLFSRLTYYNYVEVNLTFSSFQVYSIFEFWDLFFKADLIKC